MASIETVIKDPNILSALRLAWHKSQPSPSGGHEEGGFIVHDAAGTLQVIRWPKGAGDTIDVPPHRGCRLGELQIVASFHTHPNTGADYMQEPSETDKRAVSDDMDLKSLHYAGELVISAALLYLVTPSGQVVELGATKTILAQA